MVSAAALIDELVGLVEFVELTSECALTKGRQLSNGNRSLQSKTDTEFRQFTGEESVFESIPHLIDLINIW